MIVARHEVPGNSAHFDEKIPLGLGTPDHIRLGGDGFFPGTLSQALRARSPPQTTAHPKPWTCATNRCDRDVGLAESGYDRCVPTGRGLQLFRNSL